MGNLNISTTVFADFDESYNVSGIPNKGNNLIVI